MISDVELEQALRFSSRPQPLFLFSRFNDKEALALSLVSCEKVFLRESIPLKFLRSIVIHELTELAQNRLTTLKQIAFACDVAHCAGLNDGGLIETQNSLIRIPKISHLRQQLDESGWVSYSEAGAVFAQVNTEWTPSEFVPALIDELAFHNKEAFRAYTEIDNLVEKIKSRAQKWEMDLERPLEIEIKDWIISLIFDTVNPMEIRNRVKVLKDIPDTEIPQWTFEDCSQTLIPFLGDVLRKNGLGSVMGSLVAPFNVLILLPLLSLSQGNDSDILTEGLFGICEDMYCYFGAEQGIDRLPQTYFITRDLDWPLEPRKLFFCFPPNQGHADLSYHWGSSLRDFPSKKVSSTSLKQNPDRFFEEWGDRMDGYFAMQERLQVAMVGAMERARRRCVGICPNCPGIDKKSEQLDCQMTYSFIHELRREWRPIYEKVKDFEIKYLKRNPSKKIEFYLPFFRNYPGLLTREEVEERISQWERQAPGSGRKIIKILQGPEFSKAN